MRDYLYRYLDHPALLTELCNAFALTNSDSYERPGTFCPSKIVEIAFPTIWSNATHYRYWRWVALGPHICSRSSRVLGSSKSKTCCGAPREGETHAIRWRVCFQITFLALALSFLVFVIGTLYGRPKLFLLVVHRAILHKEIMCDFILYILPWMCLSKI